MFTLVVVVVVLVVVVAALIQLVLNSASIDSWLVLQKNLSW